MVIQRLHEVLNHAGVHGDGTAGAVAAAIGDGGSAAHEAGGARAACFHTHRHRMSNAQMHKYTNTKCSNFPNKTNTFSLFSCCGSAVMALNAVPGHLPTSMQFTLDRRNINTYQLLSAVITQTFTGVNAWPECSKEGLTQLHDLLPSI